MGGEIWKIFNLCRNDSSVLILIPQVTLFGDLVHICIPQLYIGTIGNLLNMKLLGFCMQYCFWNSFYYRYVYFESLINRILFSFLCKFFIFTSMYIHIHRNTLRPFSVGTSCNLGPGELKFQKSDFGT